jgi:uncharacterized protein
MQMKRFDHILALKTPTGSVLGFHSKNLEVAELSEELFSSMSDLSQIQDQEMLDQLLTWNQEHSDQVRSEPIQLKIQSLSINVTQLCNLQCVYCAAGGDGTYGNPQKRISVEQTLPQIDLLMKRLTRGDSFNITFLGGEPLLYPQGILLLAEYAISNAESLGLQVKFNVITNGTLFSEETVSILNSIRSQVTISLDGPAEINDLVRPTKGQKGVTDQVVKGIQFLVKNRKNIPSIGVQGVFGPYNRHPMKAYLFYRELGLDWFDFHYDQENSDAAASLQFAQELSEVGQLALSQEGEAGLRKIKFFDQLLHQLDSKTRIENFCGSGKSYLVLDAKNRAFTCPWSVNNPSEAVGQGLDLPVEKLQPIKNSLISTNNCNECWARFLCGGGCMWAHKKATGDRHQVDNVYCDRTRTLISAGISYYYQLRKV